MSIIATANSESFDSAQHRPLAPSAHPSKGSLHVQNLRGNFSHLRFFSGPHLKDVLTDHANTGSHSIPTVIVFDKSQFIDMLHSAPPSIDLDDRMWGSSSMSHNDDAETAAAKVYSRVFIRRDSQSGGRVLYTYL